ncbi:hypothetical protein JTB14_021608 [Gonioctena quinquepunctata]|nr:hypothetical protein JTB14_021608 [Gonioctena quinquepunctata]
MSGSFGRCGNTVEVSSGVRPRTKTPNLSLKSNEITIGNPANQVSVPPKSDENAIGNPANQLPPPSLAALHQNSNNNLSNEANAYKENKNVNPGKKQINLHQMNEAVSYAQVTAKMQSIHNLSSGIQPQISKPARKQRRFLVGKN